MGIGVAAVGITDETAHRFTLAQAAEIFAARHGELGGKSLRRKCRNSGYSPRRTEASVKCRPLARIVIRSSHARHFYDGQCPPGVAPMVTMQIVTKRNSARHHGFVSANNGPAFPDAEALRRMKAQCERNWTKVIAIHPRLFKLERFPN